MEVSIIFSAINGIGQLLTIGIFLDNLRFVRQYGLVLWGIYLLLDVTFVGLAGIVHTIFLKDLPIQDSLALANNILLILEMAIFLQIYQSFKRLEPRILIGTFCIFLIMWLVEFAIICSEKVMLLNTTLVFSKIVIVTLVWLYLLVILTFFVCLNT